MSFRFEIIVLHNVVFSFVCLLFIFAIAYIFRSFVLSHQVEFAVVLNRSLATFNTMHTLYVIRFMCRLYVIRSMHIVYVIRFICKLCHPSMYRICGIRFVHKLYVSWSLYKVYVIWSIGLFVE
jgi:hypothetical protein